MKRLCLPNPVDHFSNLPDDLLDAICHIHVFYELWVTVYGFFQVLQRCVRLSLVSRYHREWWLKHSKWSRDIPQIVRQCVNDCGQDVSQLKNMCRLADSSSVFCETLRHFMTEHREDRDRLFFPMVHKWRGYVHKSHEPLDIYNEAESLFEYYSREPCSSELFELLLAFYDINHPYMKMAIPRVEVTLPTSSCVLSQLWVYGEAKETAQYMERDNITVKHGDRRFMINTRRLKQLKLNPANNGDNPVYAVYPASYTFWRTETLTRDIKAGIRLRIALRQCRETFNK